LGSTMNLVGWVTAISVISLTFILLYVSLFRSGGLP